MLKLILIFLWKSKLIFISREFSNMISKSYFDNIMSKKILEVINKNHVQQVLMPYEGHPQQHRIFKSVKQLDKKIKTIGYMHTVLPCLPTDYIRREGFPEKILVNGQNQKKILNSFLGWDNSQVEAITSLRYTEQNKKNFQKQIFFPYYINNEKKIFKYFKKVYGSPKNKINHITSIKKNKKKTVFIGDSLEDYNSCKKTNTLFILKEHRENKGIFTDKKVIKIKNFKNFKKFLLKI